LNDFVWHLENAWPSRVELQVVGTMVPNTKPGTRALHEIITVVHESLSRANWLATHGVVAN
jgi:hypothetical protein